MEAQKGEHPAANTRTRQEHDTRATTELRRGRNIIASPHLELPCRPTFFSHTSRSPPLTPGRDAPHAVGPGKEPSIT